MGPAPRSTRIEVSPGEHVTAVTYATADRDRPGASIILAHGAGAGQASDFMVRFASALAVRGIDAITFNFVYTEEGRRAPDRNDKLEACYRKLIEAFRDGALGDAGRKLVIGGKSMGGRIASQVAAGPVGGTADLVAGLVFLGYPLHPPGHPAQLRTRHWPKIRVPMLFVQGTRDAFGTPDELQRHFATLHAPVELYAVEGGDHSLKVLKKAAIPQQAVYDAALDKIADWLRRL